MQDFHRGDLVDDKSTGTAGHSLTCQYTIRLNASEAFVHQHDGHRRHSLFQGLRVLSGGQRARTVHAAERPGQAHHYLHHFSLDDQRGNRVDIRCSVRISGKRDFRRGEDAVRIAHRDPDPHATDVNAEPHASLRRVISGLADVVSLPIAHVPIIHVRAPPRP